MHLPLVYADPLNLFVDFITENLKNELAQRLHALS
jgi:hypothetical protein